MQGCGKVSKGDRNPVMVQNVRRSAAHPRSSGRSFAWCCDASRGARCGVPRGRKAGLTRTRTVSVKNWRENRILK
eukprot:1182814-Prorocentrum_minimum.AAC.4